MPPRHRGRPLMAGDAWTGPRSRATRPDRRSDGTRGHGRERTLAPPGAPLMEETPASDLTRMSGVPSLLRSDRRAAAGTCLDTAHDGAGAWHAGSQIVARRGAATARRDGVIPDGSMREALTSADSRHNRSPRPTFRPLASLGNPTVGDRSRRRCRSQGRRRTGTRRHTPLIDEVASHRSPDPGAGALARGRSGYVLASRAVARGQAIPVRGSVSAATLQYTDESDRVRATRGHAGEFVPCPAAFCRRPKRGWPSRHSCDRSPRG